MFIWRLSFPGIFGFALNKYSNMPYQTWDLRPDMKKYVKSTSKNMQVYMI